MNSASSIDFHLHQSSSVQLPHQNKNTRLPYTYKEDVEIVKYILKHNCAFEVFGRKMWQIMERTKLGKIRTWQSLKERYIKRIRHELISGSFKFSFLTPEDLKLLRNGLKIDTIEDHERKIIKLKLQEKMMEELFDNVSD